MSRKPISPTFCVVPWTHLATNSAGAYRVCCNATSGMNLLRDQSSRPLYLNRTPVEEAWNSPTYLKIRQQMLSGERPEMCQRCFREEDSGVVSARQNWNKGTWPENPKVEAPLNVKFIDLRLGNFCNLKCRMCNPYSSQLWLEEWNELQGSLGINQSSPISLSEMQRIQNLDWPRSEWTWQHLEKVLDNVEEVYLTGGEPFLSADQYRLLKSMVDRGLSQSIILRYNTNLTKLPRKIVELWKSFKLVRINVSFDAFGELNNYIRHPSQWSELEENLLELQSLQDRGTPLEIVIHTTVQMYNILALADIIRYFEKVFGLQPYINILNHPNYLNIRVLPGELKNRVINKLEPLKNRESVREVIQYLNAESWCDDHYGDFLNYTEKLDEMRGQSVFEFFPEFRRFYNERPLEPTLSNLIES